MHKRFSRLVPAVLVPAFCLTFLAPAWGDAPQPTPAKAFLGVALDKNGDKAGVLVRGVTPESPAAKAGLKDGDVVLKIGDKEMKAPEAVVDAVKNHKPGDKLNLQVLRDGKEQTIAVTLGERPVVKVLPMPEALGKKRAAFLGIWSGELNAELKKQLGVNVDKGAVVMDVMPDSPAAKAGLKKNDVITQVGDQAIANPEELRTAVQKTEPGKEVMVKVNRGSEVKEFKVQVQSGPLSFALPRDFPMLKDGKFPFESFPGLDKDLEKVFEEFQKRTQEMEKKGTDRSL